jgi:CxxC-x17-CxxC domain-containing protein
MFDAVCSKCGNKCQVPFRPSPGKQVFCDNCFDKGGISTKNAPDYSAQFKMINEKLDKLIKLLSPKTEVAIAEKPVAKIAIAAKKEAKDIKKPVKSKPASKKIAGKKKK